jgi:tRNA-uridine 2-sulfurtransferase
MMTERFEMKKGKILLGMSGGVDSSVAAALLLKEGYDVHGVTIQTVKETDFSDAAKVADFLEIPHYIMDLTQLFKDKVINTFKQEYISGKTPNPCILCNKYIKFGELLKKAESIGIDYIATGHYAKTDM